LVSQLNQLIEGVLHVDGVAFIETYRRGDDRSNYGPVVVPPGTLFFLGDNRSNSSDSRGALGFVARERVIGRAFAVIWPSSNAGRLTGGGPTVAAAATVALQSSASRG
jgi:signal peptidase I